MKNFKEKDNIFKYKGIYQIGEPDFACENFEEKNKIFSKGVFFGFSSNQHAIHCFDWNGDSILSLYLMK